MPGGSSQGKRAKHRENRGDAMRRRRSWSREPRIAPSGLVLRAPIAPQIPERVAQRESDSGLFSSRNQNL
jgi:hypothetical protein